MTLADVYETFLRHFPAYTIERVDNELTDEQICLLLEARRRALERQQQHQRWLGRLAGRHGHGPVRVRHVDLEDLVDQGVTGFGS